MAHIEDNGVLDGTDSRRYIQDKLTILIASLLGQPFMLPYLRTFNHVTMILLVTLISQF